MYQISYSEGVNSIIKGHLMKLDTMYVYILHCENQITRERVREDLLVRLELRHKQTDIHHLAHSQMTQILCHNTVAIYYENSFNFNHTRTRRTNDTQSFLSGPRPKQHQ